MAIPAILVYGVLFMDWGEMPGRDEKPFAGVRAISPLKNTLRSPANATLGARMDQQPAKLSLDCEQSSVCKAREAYELHMKTRAKQQRM